MSESHGISTSNSKAVLQPLTEEFESKASGVDILSPVPKHPTTPLLNGNCGTELPYEGEAFHNVACGDNEMMKAIMEQLRRDVGEDDDGARSFSTIDGATTKNNDTDFDLSDFDGKEINENDGEDWRIGARRKLAAKVKRVVKEAEKFVRDNKIGRRAIAPPIEVDFSEDSEEEDDTDLTRSSNFHHNNRHTPEKNENMGTDGEATNGTRYSTIGDTLSTANVFVPPNDETDIPTATKPSFPVLQSPAPTEPLPEESAEEPPVEKDIYPSPISPPTTTLPPNIQPILKRSSSLVHKISIELPSPASVGHINSKHNNMTSSSPAPGTLVNVEVQEQQPNSTSVFAGPSPISVSTTQGCNETRTMEWSVKDTVDWLKSKGFDQDVCDKFIGEYTLLLNTKTIINFHLFPTNRTRNHR